MVHYKTNTIFLPGTYYYYCICSKRAFDLLACLPSGCRSFFFFFVIPLPPPIVFTFLSVDAFLESTRFVLSNFFFFLLLLLAARAFISSSSRFFFSSFLSRIDKAGLPSLSSFCCFIFAFRKPGTTVSSLSSSKSSSKSPRRTSSRFRLFRSPFVLSFSSSSSSPSFLSFSSPLFLVFFFPDSSFALAYSPRNPLSLPVFASTSRAASISFPFAVSSCVYVHSLPNRHIPVFTQSKHVPLYL
mmetsp:Transcript_7466/g.23343  ORF Transcript_7466/g.23343 Transcript_7466/m.23343 type:complete len:242 (-) Transcript_7466:268-993(-)